MKLDEIRDLQKILESDDPLFIQKEIERYNKELNSKSFNVYQELEMSSRYVDSHMDTSYGNSSVQLHSHPFYELLYCCNNSGVQYLIGTARYRLQMGDIVLVPPGVGHQPILSTELAEPYKRIVIWMSPEFIQSILPILTNQEPKLKKKLLEHEFPYLIRTLGTPWEFLGIFFQKGLEEAQNRAIGWQASLCGNTMQLCAQLCRAFLTTESAIIKQEKTELLDEIVSYIELHLGDQITLAGVASRFFVSESTISQTFQKKMHISFYQFVTQRRLIAAKSLIADNMRMEELCTQVGFRDYSSFYRAFKKQFGISPREYRSMILETS